MDEICQWEIGGVTFIARRATTISEMNRIFRHRYQNYVVRLKQIPMELCKDGLERDACDGHSTHFYIQRKDAEGIIGCFRLIHCEHGCLMDEGVFSGKPFVFPDRHPLSHAPMHREVTVEASRWVGHPYALADGTHVMVSMMLLDAAMQWSIAHGIKFWICAIFSKGFDNLRKYDWPFVEIPGYEGVHAYHGSKVTVCTVEVGRYPCTMAIVPIFPGKE